ncbi:MAG: aminoacyl-tRNA hydrolase, partial [candidate division WOR-3 bacterium]
AKKYGKKFRKFKDYEQVLINIKDSKTRLIKPLLFMNRSGIVVSSVLNSKPEEFMLILDDINLPLGKMRFRAKGSDGGHLGLRSVIEALNTEEFPRLRIGIANQEIMERKIDSADFVLSPFKRNEKKIFNRVIEKAVEGIEIFVSEGFEKAQNFINAIKISS